MEDVEQELLRQIEKTISRTLFRELTLAPETTAHDIEGWDSLSHTIIMMNIEKDLGIELPIEETFSLKNLKELITFIRPHLRD